MKIQTVNTFVKYVLSSGLLAAIALLSSAAIEAQTKRTVKSNRPFSVPCAAALRIGLEKVSELYDRDRQRRYGNKTDSGTEGAALQKAQQNYISCRRADNNARLFKI